MTEVRRLLDELLMAAWNDDEGDRMIASIARIRADLMDRERELLWQQQQDEIFLQGQRSDPEPESESTLPPIKPVPGKRIKSIEVACPTCKRPPGATCVAMTQRGAHGKPTKEPIKGYHVPRTEAAKAMSA